MKDWKDDLFNKDDYDWTDKNFEEWQGKMAIKFRDRSLKKGEKSHYYCDRCGAEVHPDMRDRHRCVDILPFSPIKVICYWIFLK